MFSIIIAIIALALLVAISIVSIQYTDGSSDQYMLRAMALKEVNKAENAAMVYRIFTSLNPGVDPTLENLYSAGLQRDVNIFGIYRQDNGVLFLYALPYDTKLCQAINKLQGDNAIQLNTATSYPPTIAADLKSKNRLFGCYGRTTVYKLAYLQ